MFKAFDFDQSGIIDKNDMQQAAKAAGWNPEQCKYTYFSHDNVNLVPNSLVSELIIELDPNHDGQITYEEFILIMKYIEQKQA